MMKIISILIGGTLLFSRPSILFLNRNHQFIQVSQLNIVKVINETVCIVKLDSICKLLSHSSTYCHLRSCEKKPPALLSNSILSEFVQCLLKLTGLFILPLLPYYMSQDNRGSE